MNDTFSEILVYPCTQQELDERVAARLTAHYREHVHIPPVDSPDWLELLHDSIKRAWRGVRYTEVVGAIEVHRVGTQLRGDYWFSDSKVIPGSRTRPQIRWCGKLLEVEYAGSALSSAEIFEDFRGALTQEVKRTRSLNRRHVDFEAFDRCGPYVDWRAVLGI